MGQVTEMDECMEKTMPGIERQHGFNEQGQPDTNAVYEHKRNLPSRSTEAYQTRWVSEGPFAIGDIASGLLRMRWDERSREAEARPAAVCCGIDQGVPLQQAAASGRSQECTSVQALRTSCTGRTPRTRR